MARMLEAYLAFARGDSGEQSAPTDMAALPRGAQGDAERHGHQASVAFHGHPVVTVRPAAFKRCLANLVSNAARHAHSIAIVGHRDHRWLTRHGRRRRTWHSRVSARGGVQAVPAARRRPQPGRGRHRPRARHRARHRALAWRRHRAVEFADGRLAGGGAGAGVAAQDLALKT